MNPDADYGYDPFAGDPGTSLAQTISNFGSLLRTTAEDVRRVAAYGGEQIRQGVRSGVNTPRDADSKLTFVERTWLYASDTEKLFIVLGVAGVAVGLWQLYRKA